MMDDNENIFEDTVDSTPKKIEMEISFPLLRVVSISLTGYIFRILFLHNINNIKISQLDNCIKSPKNISLKIFYQKKLKLIMRTYVLHMKFTSN